MNDQIRDHSPPISRMSVGKAAIEDARRARRERAVNVCLYVVSAASLIALAVVLRSTPAAAAPHTVERPAEFPGPVCAFSDSVRASCF